MALANLACLLARGNSGTVLMVDWDLEAPGLHRFFTGRLLDRGSRPWDLDGDQQPGLIDLFGALAQGASLQQRQWSHPATPAHALVAFTELSAYFDPEFFMGKELITRDTSPVRRSGRLPSARP